jgi:hypothetical protein
MSDVLDAPPPAAPPKPKRKYNRRPNATPKAEAKLSKYDGLTRVSCAKACVFKRCIISEKPYCAKGGLQSEDMGDPKAVLRFKEARAFILHSDVDKRST